MKKYKRQVAIWEIGTDVAEAKRGANLLAALTGKAEEACEELDESTLKGSDGVKTFLEYLSSKFPEIDVIDTPEVLTQFVKPACFRLRNEEIRDFNNRFNNLVTKLKAKKISVPDELVAFLYMAGARLPTERQASVLNGVGNVYDTQKLQNALMVNLPKVAVLDGTSDRHGGYGNGQKHSDNKARRIFVTENDGDDSDESSDDDSAGSEVPEELNDVVDQAEEQVAFFTKKFARAKDKLREAKQARGYYSKGKSQSGAGGKESDRIKKLKLRSHCGACGAQGHWRGDPECPKKNDPHAKADIPRRGAHKNHMTTADAQSALSGSSAGTPASSAQQGSLKVHTTQMTTAVAGCELDKKRKVEYCRDLDPGVIKIREIRDQLDAIAERCKPESFMLPELPEEVSAASFFRHTGNPNETYMATHAKHCEEVYISVEELVKDAGGRLTFDTACSKCVGGEA